MATVGIPLTIIDVATVEPTDLSIIYGVAITILETAQVANAQTATESSVIAVSESLGLWRTISVVENLTVAAVDGDSPLVPESVLVTDALAAPITESAALDTGVASVLSIAATESLSLDCTEILADTVIATGAEDSHAVVLDGEDVDIFGYTPQQLISLSVTDTCEIHLGERPINQIVTEAASVGLSDASPVVIIAIRPTDSVGLAGVEAVTFPTAALSVADVCVLTLTEPLDQASDLGLVDSVAAPLTDSLTIAIGVTQPIAASDSSAFGLSEGTASLTLPIAAASGESMPVGATEEGPLLAATVFAAETLRISLNEAALLVWNFLALTDACEIPATDAASLFNAFIALGTSETVELVLDDPMPLTLQVLTQLATAESLSLALADNLAQLIAIVSADDPCTGALDEQLAIFAVQPTLDDTCAVMIQAEHANVLNPFIIVVSISTSDTSLVGMDEHLPLAQIGRVTDDTLAITSEEASLTESLVLSDVWDGNNATDYAMSQPDPISYRIGQRNLW